MIRYMDKSRHDKHPLHHCKFLQQSRLIVPRRLSLCLTVFAHSASRRSPTARWAWPTLYQGTLFWRRGWTTRREPATWWWCKLMWVSWTGPFSLSFEVKSHMKNVSFLALIHVSDVSMNATELLRGPPMTSFFSYIYNSFNVQLDVQQEDSSLLWCQSQRCHSHSTTQLRVCCTVFFNSFETRWTFQQRYFVSRKLKSSSV